MASGIKFKTGFDWVGDLVNGLPAGWSAGTINFLNSTYKYGASGKGAYIWGSGRPRVYLSASYDEIVMSFHYRPWSGVITATWIQFLTNSADTVQLHINRKADGSFDFVRGSTVIASTAAGICSSTSTWYGIEIRVKFDDAAGEIEMIVDGVQVLDVGSLDTQDNGSFNDCSGFALNDPEIGWAIDNIVFRDFADDPTMYGTPQVILLNPTGAGDSTGYTASAGSNYQCVDEDVANDDTDFVETNAAAGTKDLYAMENHGISSGLVKTVGTIHRAKKTDGATRQFCALLKHSATETDGATQTLSGSYAYYFDQFDDCPGSSGWTLSQLDALQVGQKVIAP